MIVTVHSVHSNVAKIHSRLPAAMEFWLVCLGILAYPCQNTSRERGVCTVTCDVLLLKIGKFIIDKRKKMFYSIAYF